MRPRFIVTKSSAGEWRFKLQAKNGKIICISEGYDKRWSAIRAIHSLEMLILSDRPNIVVEEEDSERLFNISNYN